MRSERLGRHDLVSVRPRAAASVRAVLPDAMVRAWERAGRPLIVRRGVRGPGVPLGLPLPPAMGKRRVAFRLSPADLVARSSPSLSELTAAAPEGWRTTLAAAEALAHRERVGVSVYGALLWEALLGLDYVHPASDLDLLWRCIDRAPRGLLAGIAALAARAPMVLDGEILLGGAAVQWRELHGAGSDERVLCKVPHGAEMRPARQFLTPAAA